MRTLIVCLLSFLNFAIAITGGATTKIVLIGHALDHPPASHMYLHECELLAKCLRQSPNVEALVSDGWPANAEMLQGVSAIVLYTGPGGNILLQASHREQAERLLNGGVGYTAIHWATDASLALGTNYLEILGGWFNVAFSGLEVTTTRLVQLDPAHPICRGWKDYELHDEIYLNIKLLPEARPLLQLRTKAGDQIVAWTHERPRSQGGRSFGTTLGHFHENFGIDSFRRLLVNGILWTAHCEVPEAGAPCRISDEDMKLPPDPRVKK